MNTIRKHIAIAANETNEKKKNRGSGLTSRFEVLFFFLMKTLIIKIEM